MAIPDAICKGNAGISSYSAERRAPFARIVATNFFGFIDRKSADAVDLFGDHDLVGLKISDET